MATRIGGTISVIGVYGGAADPMPMITMFDKQIQLRMGQANVKLWVPEILPLSEAAHGYDIFQEAGRRDEGRADALTLMWIYATIASRQREARTS